MVPNITVNARCRGKYDELDQHEAGDPALAIGGDIKGTIKDESTEGEVTHFQALATAVSGTVGNGVNSVDAFFAMSESVYNDLNHFNANKKKMLGVLPNGIKSFTGSIGPLITVSENASTVDTTKIVTIILIKLSNRWNLPIAKINTHEMNNSMMDHSPKNSKLNKFSKNPAATNPTAPVTKNIEHTVIIRYKTKIGVPNFL